MPGANKLFIHRNRPCIIDEKLAKGFLDDPDNVDLHGGTEITDDAAELLSKHGGSLDLRGLTEVSDTAVESLAQYQTAWLNAANAHGLSELVVTCRQLSELQKIALQQEGFQKCGS